MRNFIPWMIIFGIVGITRAQHVAFSEWKLADPTATIEGFNELRDASIRALRREADAGFVGYQDFTIKRDADGQPVTEPTILAVVQWTSLMAADEVTMRLASQPGGFLDAFLAVEIVGGHEYNGPGAGDIEELNTPFQALGFMVHNLTDIADANFTQSNQAFLSDLLTQTGVVKTMMLPNPEAGIFISLVVYTSLDAFDTLFANGYFVSSSFLTDYPPMVSLVGEDTDVGVEGTLNPLIALSVWTVLDGTIDEFRDLRDGSIQALRRREELGFMGYQDYTLSSNLTTFDTPTIIAVTQYVDQEAEDLVISQAVAEDPLFLEAFMSVATVATYGVTDPTGALLVEDLNKPFQTISYTAFNFLNYDDFDFVAYSQLRDDFLTAEPRTVSSRFGTWSEQWSLSKCCLPS